MEIKINKEIRGYTESMFFGLNARQFIFALLAVGLSRHGNRVVAVHIGRCAVCRDGLFEIQRHDGGEVLAGVYPLRVSHAQAPDIQTHQHLL